MGAHVLSAFGIENLHLEDRLLADPGPGEVRVRIAAMSLNFRDFLVVTGRYNKKLPLPMVPISDGAGVVTAVGDGVAEFQVGHRVMTHYAVPWQDGPFEASTLKGTLGSPGPGVATTEVVLSAQALVAMPTTMSFDEAATLPIAALTAWSSLVTEGQVGPGSTILTLGTGGVSVFAIQLGKTLGARVIVTSRSDAKLERAKALGADETINYRSEPEWDRRVYELTGGRGVDVVVENGGVGTLSQSLRAVRPGGVIAMLGALTGLRGDVDISPILMKRIRVAGIFCDSRRAFLDLVRHLEAHPIRPVIDRRFAFEELPDALRYLGSGMHFGKIVVRGDDRTPE